MSDPAVNDLQDRLTWVERDLEQLSKVVAQQHDVLERLRAEVEQLRAARPVGDAEPESRTLEDDRPPHY